MPDTPRHWRDSSWRFIIVGMSNAVIGFTLFHLSLAALAEVPFKATISQLIAYAVGIAWSFYLNRRWTFRSQGKMAAQAARFTSLQIALALLSSAAIGLSVDHWGNPATMSWLVVMAAVTLLNFTVSRTWAFR